ncbi:MAG: hypothetical protein WBA12_12740, partial [Catalinimonas sp.]
IQIKPADNVVWVLENRDLRFDGSLKAGYFETAGTDMIFRYDEFAVDIEQIDSLTVATEEDPENNKSALRGTLTNRSEGSSTSGRLVIGDPNNKSALKSQPKFPRFDITSESFVYFDNPGVLGGAYDQNVYFKVPPFVADSINSSSPESLAFKGTFHSDDIFPDFEQKLTPQEDGQLGFTHQTPPDGYPVYGGDGQFFGEIRLDGSGLRGKGRIEYLSSVVASDDFIFYQDSVVGTGDNAVIASQKIDGTWFPDVAIDEYRMKWVPDGDSMSLYNATAEQPFQLYEATAEFDGQLTLTPDGTVGNGLLKTRNSQLLAQNIRFGENRISGREADFDIKSDNPLKPAVVSRNVAFEFDLAKGLAEFSPEVEGFASNEFPYAQYKTSLGKAIWDLDAGTVTMQKPKEAPLETSYFYSTRADQDSLAFLATEAVYNVQEQRLDIEGVPYIMVADAKIIPADGLVTIRENAAMDELTNAELVVDTLNEYHRLSEGIIQINSRNAFQGEAYYDYTTTIGETFKIKFNNFAFEAEEQKRKRDQPALHTVSGGVVDDDNPMPIANGVLYRGDVMMYAQRPYLEFKGEVKLDIKSSDLESTWFTYSNPGNTPDFTLDLADVTTADGKPLSTGLHVEKRSTGLYFSFLSTKNAPEDFDVFRTSGVLQHDPERQEFVVGDLDKLSGASYEGSMFAVNDSLGTYSYEGGFQFMDDGAVKLSGAGSGRGRAESNSYSFQTMLVLDVSLPGGALDELAGDLSEAVLNSNAPIAFENVEPILPRLGAIFGDKVARDYQEAAVAENAPLMEATSKLKGGIVIADVTLRWSNERSAWYSEGLIGLSNVGETNIDARVEGHIELRKTYPGDVLTVYFEAAGTWYYLHYNTDKAFSAVSTNGTFNDIIADKGKGGRAGTFHVQPAEFDERGLFVRDFNHSYLGKEVEIATQPEPETAVLEEEDSKEADGKEKPADATPPDATAAEPAEPVVEDPESEDVDGF